MKKFESERNTPFSVILGFIPRIHEKHSSLDTRDRLSVTPEYDREQSLIKGLDVVCQCASLLERRVQSSTRVRKTQAVTRQTNECIETPESGVDKVVSSCEKNPNVHKTYMNFLRQRKTVLDAPLHAVSSGRLLPQCAPDATGFLSDVYKRGTRARKFLVDGVQCGRSMIEMLGVLAIIGVLSVGGIQGFSKAMREYRSNQQKQQLSQVFSTVISLKNSIGDYPQTFDNITYILDALNEIPDGFSYKNQRLHDDYGNIILLRHGLQTWTNEDGSSGSAYYYLLTLQFSGNGFLFSPDGEDFCRNALLTVQAFRNDIKSINLLITTQSSKVSDSKPLGGKNLDEAISSPVKIQQTCQFCKSSTSLCNLNIVINK